MIAFMEIEGEGYYSSEKEKKPTLYQKISQSKQKRLSRYVGFAETEMDKHLNKAQECLVKVDTIQTRSKIEMEKYGNTSTSIAVEHYKRLAVFNFFVTMLGYIDSKIKYERERIEFASHFTVVDDACNNREHYDEIDSRKENIANYLIDREEILDDLKTIIGNDFYAQDLMSVLKEAPSYLKFASLYENCENDTSNLELISNLISAYNIGLVTKDYYGTNNSYESRIANYRKLYSDLTIHVDTNNAELKNVKVNKKK